MRNKTRLGKALAVGVAMVATMGFAASSASAYGNFLGHFSPDGTIVESGTLTLTLGAQSASCGYYSAHSSAASTGSGSCTGGGSLLMRPYVNPLWNGGNTQAAFANWAGASSPWGTIQPFGGFQVPVVNGNASTPTKMVFSNTRLGHVGGAPLYATGDLTVTTLSGGLVTVTP